MMVVGLGGLMGQLGFSEMLVIFVVALLVFGPKKLPELGKSLGKGIREFKKATDELKTSWEDQVKDIKAPLNDVKQDIHNMGRDMKDDFYKSLEPEQAVQTVQTVQSAQPAPASPDTLATPHPTESAETTAPKDHA